MSGTRRTYGVMTDRWGWQPFAWIDNGVLTWSWRSAPAGLVTRRQMRAEGLAPAGAEPVARVVCRNGRRWAALWLRAELGPKRRATPAQMRALKQRAMAARRWCPVGRHDAGYCIRRSLGACEDCAASMLNGSIGAAA